MGGEPSGCWLILGWPDGSASMDRCSLGVDVGPVIVGGVCGCSVCDNISLGFCVGEDENTEDDGCKVGSFDDGAVDFKGAILGMYDGSPGKLGSSLDCDGQLDVECFIWGCPLGMLDDGVPWSVASLGIKLG